MFKTLPELRQERTELIAEARQLIAAIEAASPTAAYADYDTNDALKIALRHLRLSEMHSQKKYRG